MGRSSSIGGFLAMKTSDVDVQSKYDILTSDLKQFKEAAKSLASDAIKLGGLGFGTTFLQWVASISAIYLLVLDRTNWRTNMLTSLLVPYVFLTLPKFVFSLLRGEVGKWLAFIAVVVKLFFPRQIPVSLEVFGSLVLIVVVSPSLFADTVRGNLVGVFVCFVIGCYLLQEHIHASGGFRNAFSKANGISNTVGIVLLFAYPVWALVLWAL